MNACTWLRAVGVARLSRGVPAALLLALAALALAAVLRAWVVEAPELALACEASPWRGSCVARSLLIQGFIDARIGWFALGAAGLGLLLANRPLAALGLFAGCLGLVLYSSGPSAPASLLALLAFVRAGPLR